jgi:hypothetical protein
VSFNPRWSTEARTNFDLRWDGTNHVLVTRRADASGNNYEGEPMFWKDIATIPSWLNAKDILRRLRASEPPYDTPAKATETDHG